MTKNSSGQELLLRMLLDSLEALAANEDAYGCLEKSDDPDFQKATEIAAERLAQANKLDSSEPGALFFVGLLYHDEYLREDYGFSDIEELIETAREDYLAYAVLRWLDHSSQNIPAPPCLQAWRNQHYLGLFKPPNRPRGVPTYANVHRNALIIGEIQRLLGAGFKPTRNKAGTTLSACDVIATALERNGSALSYSAVETIWLNRDSLPKSGLLSALPEALLRVVSS